MSRKWTPKELLYDLVSIQSDSFTAQEIQISRHIFELIQEQGLLERTSRSVRPL